MVTLDRQANVGTALMRTLSYVLLLALASLAQATEPPDRIYVNAKVWTGDPAAPAAEAFAIRGDWFVAVGKSSEVRALAGPDTIVTDLEGHRVVPGFNDAHWHLPARRDARLDNAESVEVIQQRLRDYAATLPADAWVTGRGWTPTDFPDNTAHRHYLDAIFLVSSLMVRGATRYGLRP